MLQDSSWMNLENIYYAKGKKTAAKTYYMIAFICKVQKRQIYSNRKQVSGHSRAEG